MDIWDLANDRDCEKVLEYFFSLRDNVEDSEVEADEDASKELNELDKSSVNSSVSLNGCVEGHRPSDVIPVMEQSE